MEIDEFEQEVEFDRLCASLTGDGSDKLVSRLHASQTQSYGVSKLVHLHTVAELANRHATYYYADHDFNEQRYRKASCRLLGLLHESMEWGASFEDVVAVSDELVARAVASLTIDKRLPRPKRLEMFVNQMGRASEPAQIVKLADLQSDITYMLAKSTNTNDLDFFSIVRRWVDDVLWLWPSLTKIKESMALADQVNDLWDKVLQLDNKCKAIKKLKNRR